MNLKKSIALNLGSFSLIWLVMVIFSDAAQNQTGINLFLVGMATWIAVETDELLYINQAFVRILVDLKVENIKSTVMKNLNYKRLLLTGILTYAVITFFWRDVHLSAYHEIRTSYFDMTFIAFISVYLAIFNEMRLFYKKSLVHIYSLRKEEKESA